MNKPLKDYGIEDSRIAKAVFPKGVPEDATDNPPFVAVRQSGIVMRGKEFIARARSHTMAKRIANALNLYKPNDRGE